VVDVEFEFAAGAAVSADLELLPESAAFVASPAGAAGGFGEE
jgi:hypothetical protein